MRAGRAAERLEDFDRAVVEYEKVLRATPDDITARLSLQRAKLRAAAYHDQRARHLAGTGKLEEALIELQIAAELNPASGDIDTRLRELRTQLRAKLAVAHRRQDPAAVAGRERRPICSRPASSCRAASPWPTR